MKTQLFEMDKFVNKDVVLLRLHFRFEVPHVGGGLPLRGGALQWGWLLHGGSVEQLQRLPELPVLLIDELQRQRAVQGLRTGY